MTVLFTAGGLAACGVMSFGSDRFPLGTMLWAMILWPVALIGLLVWIFASPPVKR
jgi:TM2 domain-containing membrane protein YozV